MAAEPPPPTAPSAGGGGSGGDGPDDSDGSTFGDLPPSETTTTDPDAAPTTEADPDEGAPGGGADGSGGAGGGGSAPDLDDLGADVEVLACPDGVDPVICDAAEFVQRVRGRPFKTFPVVELMENEAFDASLLSDFDLYVDELDADDATLTALGLIPPDVSLVEAFRESLEVGVVGFYDPSTEQLVVRGEDLGLYTQLVLVHELVHAFDDQWFDLDRSQADDEADYGFSAVIEGNATRVENLWRSRLSSDDQATLAREELGTLSAEDLDRLDGIPFALQALQASAYLDGEVYVDAIVADGGEAAVDAALTDPPSSSEEILHPETDRATDPEIDVPAPAAESDVVDQGRLGELVIQLWLGSLAGEGWGGDRYTTFRTGGQDCIVVALVGDDDRETAEMATVAGTWASLDPDRTATETTIDGRDGVRVRACA